MPTGWLVTRWNKTLFQETLPDLVKYHMLAYPGSRGRSPRKKRNKQPKANPEHNKDGTYNYNLDLEEGVVFLPFCAHVCKELVGGMNKLKPYYAITSSTFMKKNELPGHALWKGTITIDGKIMQHRLRKQLDQEEIYCTFQPKDIYKSIMEDKTHTSTRMKSWKCSQMPEENELGPEQCMIVHRMSPPPKKGKKFK